MAGAMAGRETFYCYACLRRHAKASAIGRGHARFDIEADASTSALQSHIREFSLQTRGVQAALRILGIEGVRIHPPRFGRGWPPKEEVERRYRDLVKHAHPDAGGRHRGLHLEGGFRGGPREERGRPEAPEPRAAPRRDEAQGPAGPRGPPRRGRLEAPEEAGHRGGPRHERPRTIDLRRGAAP